MIIHPILKNAAIGGTLVIAATMNACRYDVAAPLWDQPYTNPPTPVITGISPAQRATPGVNTITITGQYLDGVQDTNGVYFGNTTAEILQKSPTSILVRRPALATDSCSVKVISSQALIAGKFVGSYRIDTVLQEYGSFLDNAPLSVLALDGADNLFVVETGRRILKITPDGQKTVLGTATRAPTDGRIGRDGRLYMPGNNRSIDVVNLTSGAVTTWLQLPSGRVVRFGDFDANGNFYAGGAIGSQLVVVRTNLTTSLTGLYTTDEILAIRVYNSFVYVAARPNAQTPATIRRHQITDTTGTLGAAELVVDLATTPYSQRTIKGFVLSSNGKMYVITDSPDHLLVVDLATNAVDIFYKNIIPSYAKHFGWGAGTSLYAICGDTPLAATWKVYKIAIGTTSAY